LGLSLLPFTPGMVVTLPFVLIDFENVQPKMLQRLRPGSFRVKVFLGQNQSKLMLDLVQALQPFGSDAEYIQIQGSGPDAVDFHIAFYIGQLAAAEPGTSFTIVSKDRGFDPLIRHLAQRGIDCRRMVELPHSLPAEPVQPTVSAASQPAKPTTAKPAAIAKQQPPAAPASVPAKKAASASTTRARAKSVVEHLRKATKPAKLATLRTSIKAWFKPALDDKAVDAILQSLQDSKKVAVSGAKVLYTLG
jgi:hypothetical protein